jgi:hypothetical protein
VEDLERISKKAPREYILNKKHLNTLLLSIAEATEKGHKIRETVQKVNGAGLAFYVVKIACSEKTAIILNAFFNINYLFFQNARTTENNTNQPGRKN